jgi:hypothetical protein
VQWAVLSSSSNTACLFSILYTICVRFSLL